MADIRTRSSTEKSVKSISHKGQGTFQQARRVREDFIKTKEYMENRRDAKEESAETYAAGQVSEKGSLLARRGAIKANEAGTRIFRMGKETFLRRRTEKRTTDAGKAQRAGRETAKAGKNADVFGRSAGKAGRHTAGKGRNAASAQAVQHARNSAKNIHRARMTEVRIRRTAASAAFALKRTAVSIAVFAKSLAAGAKALGAFLAAGGWATVVIVLIVVVLGASITFFGNQESSCLPVSEQVEAYDPLIRKYAEMHGIAEYVDLIKAVMMQESGGKGTDPMQASECGYNKKYPNAPNGITDPEYSINVGIQNLAACLKAAEVESPVDMDNIKLALQGYNFGNGFISWAKEKYGGYSQDAAREFSEMMAKKNGWSSYGDVDYVAHVTRYYPYSGYSYGMMFFSTGILGLPIEGMKKADITSPLGARWGEQHTGTDFGFPPGTPIYACESGTVTLAGWNGGYGKCVIIDHGNGMQTLYAHQSKINVAKGQKVIRGQCIGEVGNTGNSTGPHLHLEIIINGKYVDPMKGYLNMP